VAAGARTHAGKHRENQPTHHFAGVEVMTIDSLTH
jgi:hypothetical protein